MMREKSKKVKTSTEPSVNLICSVLSSILSEKYGCEITLTAEPKNSGSGNSGEKAV